MSFTKLETLKTDLCDECAMKIAQIFNEIEVNVRQ